MQLYAIMRRDGWATAKDLDAAAARSMHVANHQMPDDIRWIRSYVLDEGDGRVGTFCVYEASSPEAIRTHAQLAGLPVDAIVSIGDTVVIRQDPEPATV